MPVSYFSTEWLGALLAHGLGFLRWYHQFRISHIFSSRSGILISNEDASLKAEVPLAFGVTICADQPAWQMWGIPLVSCPTGQVLGCWQRTVCSQPRGWCNTSAWDSCWAAQVMFRDGSSKFCHSPYWNLNVCGQVKSCLYSLDAEEVGGNVHWIMPVWCFSVNTLSTGAGVVVCSVCEVTDLVRHSLWSTSQALLKSKWPK